ncbi:MAG: hypothetical protein AB1695_12535 [Stygiobacter sp.]
MILLDNKYNIGDIVYLKTDPDQVERMITAIQLNANGIIYRLVCGTTETWHYDIEINVEKVFNLDKKNQTKG